MFRLFRFVVLTLFASSLLMIAGPMAGGAQEATPEAECPVTTPEENEELVTMYWEEVWWGDQGKIAEIVAPDEVHHWGIGGDTTGIEAFNERWALFFEAFPDLEFGRSRRCPGRSRGNALDGDRHASRRMAGYCTNRSRGDLEGDQLLPHRVRSDRRVVGRGRPSRSADPARRHRDPLGHGHAC